MQVIYNNAKEWKMMGMRSGLWQGVLTSVVLASSLQAAVLLEKDFEDGALAPWVSYSVASDADWSVDSFDGSNQYAIMNGYGADTASDDWLISPVIDFDAANNEVLSFDTAKNFDGGNMEALISTDYDGVSSPETFTWTPLNAIYSAGDYVFTGSGLIDLSEISGNGYIAFRYTSTGTAPGDGALWEVDNILLEDNGGGLLPLEVAPSVDVERVIIGQNVTFTAGVNGGNAPYTYAWDLGDGSVSTMQETTHAYANAGTYTVSLEVTDVNGTVKSVALDANITVRASVDVAVPTKVGDVRIATFNASMNRANEGDLAAELQNGGSEQIGQVTSIIQAVNPDIILVNEFDFGGDSSVELFIQNYLKQGENAVDYPYFFVAPSNTGIPSGYDYNNDGTTDQADDAYGFGAFPGQYGMVVLSKYPIDTDNVRTFQNFLWKDMPNALLPVDPETEENWYNEAETATFRLSSKSHWDIPVTVDGNVVHVLASHPTPPVFDGDEDRNGKRNHDEIRLWADYLSDASYIYDDNGQTGGFGGGRFVILGDQNADPDEGDSYDNAISQILSHELVNTSVVPESDGAAEEAGDRDDTSSFNYRVDYVLPSVCGFELQQSGHFWPTYNDVKFDLIDSSDHRLVWMDMNVVACAAAEAGDADTDNGDDGILPATTPFGWLLMLLAMMGMATVALRTEKE